ncbi:hypothetical protein J6590_028868 [Homalodisca vitripennis]|nr:hypothetical protein J6590_028868 [Homalodisca vitripennis]
MLFLGKKLSKSPTDEQSPDIELPEGSTLVRPRPRCPRHRHRILIEEGIQEQHTAPAPDHLPLPLLPHFRDHNFQCSSFSMRCYISDRCCKNPQARVPHQELRVGVALRWSQHPLSVAFQLARVIIASPRKRFVPCCYSPTADFVTHLTRVVLL